MATVAKSGTPSLASIEPPANHRINGLLAGEALAAGDLLYVKSDGKLWRSNGTAATAPAKCIGVAVKAADAGEAITAYWGCVFQYGAGMTPGTQLYVSATPGALSDVATTGGTAPIGFVVDATRVFIDQSHY